MAAFVPKETINNSDTNNVEVRGKISVFGPETSKGRTLTSMTRCPALVFDKTKTRCIPT